jgi:hypothetical protein
MKQPFWWLGFFLCALLWAGSGCLVLVVLFLWPLSDAHYHGPQEIFLDPSFLAVLIPSVLAAVIMTWVVFRYREH